MLGIVVAAHGGLAQGFAEAIELIIGVQEQMEFVNLQPGMSPEDLKNILMTAVKAVDTGDGSLIAVDLFGGTPCNVALTITAEVEAVCLTGVNLGILLEAIGIRDNGADPQEIAEKLVEVGKEGIQQLKIS
jgi:PTS system mannose-specific IIB component